MSLTSVLLPLASTAITVILHYELKGIQPQITAFDLIPGTVSHMCKYTSSYIMVVFVEI